MSRGARALVWCIIVGAVSGGVVAVFSAENFVWGAFLGAVTAVAAILVATAVYMLGNEPDED